MLQTAGGTKETKVYFGTRERNRTSDQKFRKLLLYPLSYPGTSPNISLLFDFSIERSTFYRSIIRDFCFFPLDGKGLAVYITKKRSYL